MNDQKRAENLRNQIQSTVKQMETTGTELECFQALQKRELLGASNRINGLWEEVQKQKELEQTLQKRYGDQLAELERVSQCINEYRIQAQKQEEIAAEKLALKAAEENHIIEQNSGASEALRSEKLGSSVPAEQSHDENPGPQIDAVHMDVDSGKDHITIDVDVRQNVVEANPDAVAPETVIHRGSSANEDVMEVPSAEVDNASLASKEAEANDNLSILNGDSTNKQTGEDVAISEPVNTELDGKQDNQENTVILADDD